ncbi:MAG TPA: nucleotidyltransferase family protein [Planctomycetota bacterium]|nr:nucleotidyltransferase family protein [Planctomycetota bacterium]
MKLILLAAGFATRMYPLTRDHAKPLLEVGGEAILDHIVRRALTVEAIDGAVLITNGRFRADFDRWRDSGEWRVPVEVIDDGVREADERLGAVADLQLAIEAARPAPDESLLVMAGDNLIGFDLSHLDEEFRRRGCSVVAMRELDGPIPPSHFGEITVDGEGLVTAFREKPADPRSPLASTGIYFFTPEVRPLLARYLEEGGEGDAPGHFLSWLVHRVPVAAAPIPGPWFDVGNLATLAEARAAFGDPSAPSPRPPSDRVQAESDSAPQPSDGESNSVLYAALALLRRKLDL